MLTYDYLAGWLILICGAAIAVFYATERDDNRPLDAEDHPEVETKRDQRARMYEGG